MVAPGQLLILARCAQDEGAVQVRIASSELLLTRYKYARHVAYLTSNGLASGHGGRVQESSVKEPRRSSSLPGNESNRLR